MKTSKLLIASLFIFSFLLTTNAYSQAKVWYFDHPHQVYQPCIGEAIQGQMFMHFIDNGKFRITNLSGEYTGVETGKKYKVLGNWKREKGTPNFNISIRVLDDNGRVYMLHAVFKNNKLTIDGCK